MSFLPDNYEKPVSQSNFMRLEQGENRFRILSSAIVGWIDWKREGEKNTPVRTKDRQPNLNTDRQSRHFWAFVVWDYRDHKVKILEITQTTIQDAIYSLHANQDWGDPKNYDLIVKKTGEKMETVYNVIPVPPKKADQRIFDEYSKTKIDLNKLYSGENPFLDEATTDRGTQDLSKSYPSSEDDIQTSSIPF